METVLNKSSCKIYNLFMKINTIVKVSLWLVHSKSIVVKKPMNNYKRDIIFPPVKNLSKTHINYSSINRLTIHDKECTDWTINTIGFEEFNI